MDLNAPKLTSIIRFSITGLMLRLNIKHLERSTQFLVILLQMEMREKLLPPPATNGKSILPLMKQVNGIIQ